MPPTIVYYTLCILLIVIGISCGHRGDPNPTVKTPISDDLDQLLSDIEEHYVYLAEREVDLDCIRAKYRSMIGDVKTDRDALLFFEKLMNEFGDSHLILNANTASSYRIYAPIYASIEDGQAVISQIWQSQIEPLEDSVVGSTILTYNDQPIDDIINNYPSVCTDKKDETTREWILNKALSGRRDEPRILILVTPGGREITLDIDQIDIREETDLLSYDIKEDIGIIRINNALGDEALIKDFDTAMDDLSDTEGIILDLRNTIDGGNTSVARPIMGRFIDRREAYQIHENKERRWTEYVEPRGPTYSKPLIILVGRWTGSMGEGLAIGLEGMQRGTVVGTEMTRLAGAMNGFPFKHRSYQYRLSVERLFHVNGTPREQYIPGHYVATTSTRQDEILDEGLRLMRALVKEEGN